VRHLTAWLDEVGYPDAVVHNAAVGFFGPFADTPLADHEGTVGLGVRATVELTHAVLPKLTKNASGHLVYIGSTSGRKPVPYMSVYSSTKAFIHHFACALREELAGGRPKVLLIVPGAVRTDFPRLAGLPATFTAKGLAPAAVGETIVQAIEQGREGTITVGSVKERCGGFLQRLLPPAYWARKMRKAYAPMLAQGRG
jgi:short-subunit dehydrogenase